MQANGDELNLPQDVHLQYFLKPIPIQNRITLIAVLVADVHRSWRHTFRPRGPILPRSPGVPGGPLPAWNKKRGRHVGNKSIKLCA